MVDLQPHQPTILMDAGRGHVAVAAAAHSLHECEVELNQLLCRVELCRSRVEHTDGTNYGPRFWDSVDQSVTWRSLRS